MTQDPLAFLYTQLGEPILRELGTAFYTRVYADPLIGPMHPQDDREGAERNFTEFLIQRCGGPQTYNERRGHPRLRMRHMPFTIGAEARDAWLSCMKGAMDEIDFPENEGETLMGFFGQVAEMMRNQ